MATLVCFFQKHLRLVFAEAKKFGLHPKSGGIEIFVVKQNALGFRLLY